MDNNSIEKLELNKILASVADYATLNGGKSKVLSSRPSTDLEEVRQLLDATEECDKLLYTYGIGKIEVFPDIKDNLSRAEKGSILSFKELLDCAALLRSARRAYTDVDKIDEQFPLTESLIKNLYFDSGLEDDILNKIISVDALSDNASDRLYSIRTKIKTLNAKIREKFADYTSGKFAEYLQDGIVTMRNGRYVVPVKAEFKNRIKGFVHDRSQTGATFFIEPEYILELNNELISLTIDEREEVEAILKALSNRVGAISGKLGTDIEILSELDSRYARAEYGYVHKCAKPNVNGRGLINIIKGRHPLIDKSDVVPISLELGINFYFLLLSGANTGGKTVTLKMCGLFCLMAACGIYIPAAEGSSVSVFSNVFCDIGDRQSIEESLSTFSSHISNIVKICDGADGKSLVLIDEPGGGTNPDEGQAIAKAVVKYLLDSGAKGIVTTHYTSLKEFAYTVKGIENASMEFDSETLKPLYRIKIGLPGASNALAISKRLGMKKEILEQAENFLSDGAKNFENIVTRAEESRIEAEKKLSEIDSMENEWREKLKNLNSKIEEINREKEKINRSARAESKRIINERTQQAEEMLAQIEEIFRKEELKEVDLIAARTLKNKLKGKAYEEEEEKKQVTQYAPLTRQNIKVGSAVYIKPMECKGEIASFSAVKDEAEVTSGSIKMHLKFSDLLFIDEQKEKPKYVKVVKKLTKNAPVLEINVLGMTVEEALYEVDNFIDSAVTESLPEIKVIHGVGTGRLKNAIAQHLKRHKNVESFRLGKYGEGETGVTFIKLK